MDLTKLYDILSDTTVQFRKGPVFAGTPGLVGQAERGEELTGGGVLEIYAMPHVDEAPPGLELVDVEFLAIGVDRTRAEARQAELLAVLAGYPEPDRLAEGPSYIEVGAAVGDQGAAFQFFALGKVLGLWDVVTPATFGLSGSEARRMAGLGLVMITGWRG
jgi:hypothetical protein